MVAVSSVRSTETPVAKHSEEITHFDKNLKCVKLASNLNQRPMHFEKKIKLVRYECTLLFFNMETLTFKNISCEKKQILDFLSLISNSVIKYS